MGIDGPDGVGKTVVARELAAQLRRRWLSVGMLYRALAPAGASPDAVIAYTVAQRDAKAYYYLALMESQLRESPNDAVLLGYQSGERSTTQHGRR